jgi:nucleotide-binding universal stress UspA family protein
MERHLLLTVSDDTSSRSAVQFVGQFFSQKRLLKVTLMYVAPDPKEVLQGSYASMSEENSREIARQKSQYQKKGRAALEKGWEDLLSVGIPPGNISTIFRFRALSTTVKDIAQEAEKGLYDAIVLGRRGLSRLEELLSSSVSKQILEETLSIPFWINRDISLGRQGILIGVDGSEPCLRVTDHVGFMVFEESHPITLLHVQTPDGPKPEEALDQARGVLIENEIPADRIQTKLIKSSDPATAIFNQVRRRQYAVVAVGNSGQGPYKFMDRPFIGSVSRLLCTKITGTSLWVSS